MAKRISRWNAISVAERQTLLETCLQGARFEEGLARSMKWIFQAIPVFVYISPDGGCMQFVTVADCQKIFAPSFYGLDEALHPTTDQPLPFATLVNLKPPGVETKHSINARHFDRLFTLGDLLPLSCILAGQVKMGSLASHNTPRGRQPSSAATPPRRSRASHESDLQRNLTFLIAVDNVCSLHGCEFVSLSYYPGTVSARR